MTNVLYELRDVAKTYRSRKQITHALHDIDLEILAGDFLTITGATGSGKSTLLGLLAGVTAPTGGRFSFEGQPLPAKKSALRRELQAKVTLVPNCRELNADTTVQQYVMMGAASRARRGTTPVQTRRALAAVGLGQQGNDRLDQLSMGERQLACIAHALAHEPKALLIDEPLANLNDRDQQVVLASLTTIWERGMTLIVATSDAALADQGAFQIRLEAGAIIDQTRALELDDVLRLLADEDAALD